MHDSLFQPGGTLEWRQPGSAKEGYVLTAGNEEVARLSVNGWRVSSARATSAFGNWIFKKEGFWHPQYLIREEATEIDVAEFFPKWHWSSGRIQFVNGKEFTWKAEGFFSRQYSMRDQAGTEVFRLREGLGTSFWKDLFKQQGRIEVGKASVDPKIMSVLSLVAWHLVLVLRQQRAAASAG
jgi:hypothetical protein